MTRYNKSMREILFQIREGYSPKEIKMAIGIATDKRYKGGNYTGAVNAIEKIKKGLSDHPQVKAVLQRVNEAPEDMEPASPDEGSMAMDQLQFIEYAAEKMMEHIQGGGEFPEWMQNKLSGTHEKMKSLYANISHDEMKEEVALDEKVEYVEYKFRNKNDAMKAKQYFDGIQLMSFDINDDDITNGELYVDAGNKDMTKYHNEVMKKFRPKVLTQEELELDEMKMDDPKLVKAFDKLKKGSTVKLKTSSTISKGKDFVDYVVKSKNMVNKGRVEKITLVTKGNEGAVKKFLYKRDGKVTFAIGDMGASIDDIKEGTWALPDSPKAKAELKKLMSKPIKLGKEGDDASDKLYALIGDDELFDDLYVAGKKNPNGDARDIVKKHMKRLGIKEEVELEEKLKVSDGLGAWIDDFKKSDAPQFQGKSDEEKKNMAIAAFTDAGGKLEQKEETELDEAPKMKYALVGTDMKIYSMGSDERDLRLDRRSLEKRFKDVAPLKMARLKTAQSIGDKVDKSQLKEEEGEPQKPDSAKAVDQMRDDKKKTRIAQLQLQIAKAQETINKLNAQEKPSE